jgi:hypothetical protein
MVKGMPPEQSRRLTPTLISLWQTIGPGALACAPVIPLIASAATVCLYVVVLQDARALFYGIGFGVLVWLFLAFAVGPFMAGPTANRSVHQELRARLAGVRAEGQTVPLFEVGTTGFSFVGARVRAQLDELEKELGFAPRSSARDLWPSESDVQVTAQAEPEKRREPDKNRDPDGRGETDNPRGDRDTQLGDW